MSEPRRPVPFWCSACQHEWVGMYLPLPIDDACRCMSRATCPNCGAGVKDVRLALQSTKAREVPACS